MTTTVALIGNPNCGKTTLFNLLTGAHQKVGNWPGVTVERKSGNFKVGDRHFELVDLPGIYSLEQDFLGMDEKIARDFIERGHIDLIINIVDATNLERNLILTQQLLEKKLPMIVVVNMLDVAEQQGITVDPEKLGARLGISTLPIIASKGQGMDEVYAALGISLDSHTAVSNDFSALDKSESLATDEVLLKRYHRSRKLVSGVVEVNPVTHSLSEKIDAVLINRWLGVPFFLLMIYLMFTIAINVGAVFIDFFDIIFGAVLIDGTTWALYQLPIGDTLQAVLITLLAKGVGGGITLVATFIPVIGFLYLCLSFL